MNQEIERTEELMALAGSGNQKKELIIKRNVRQYGHERRR